jgi:hypothetical protein
MIEFLIILILLGLVVLTENDPHEIDPPTKGNSTRS